MKKILLIACGIICHMVTLGQSEENIWAFGDKAGLDFSAANPVAYANNLFPGYEGSASICSSSGQLLFYTNGFWVWNRHHEIMPELTGGVSGYTAPVATVIGYPPMMPWNGGYATQATTIAGMPVNKDKYYLFSLSTAGQLYYTIIDMSLNSGKGGVVVTKKGIQLATGLTEKLTVVKGCNNIWVMVRAKTTNQYKAYEINDTGIVTTPVISNCGNLPLGWYRYGVIKFSPDGSKMAAACNAANNNKGGLELYDFNSQTGVLSNPIVLDSSSTLGYYYGTCFSPDNSKLYTSTSSFSHANSFYSGKVRQFNLSLGTTAAVIASNTIVFTDFSNTPDKLGDLKRGKNGKIYFSSGEPAVSTMHSINTPNFAGVSCNAAANVIALPPGSTYRGLPNDIAVINAPDTLKITKQVTVCFRDSVILTANNGKGFQWQNGSTEKQITVTANGTYVVSYINTDCKYETDSFKLQFISLPVISSTGYSCPGSSGAVAWIKPQPGDTILFQYRWRESNGNVLQQNWSNNGDTVKAIDTGRYYVQITTPSGCDTTLSVTILTLPVPNASFHADSIACMGMPVSFINTSNVPIWKWYFGDGQSSGQQHPDHEYSKRGSYTSSLIVTNIEGCSDTTQNEISIKGLDLTLSTDKDLVNKSELVHLQSSGNEPYMVTAWQPAVLFADQLSYSQTIAMDTTTTFEVMGVSAFGCVAKATVLVEVNPIVFMPTAFSPNGDGLNDRFRPVSTGYIFVRYFEVYNRFGQQVYSAYAKKALEGWDGTFNGQQMDIGTYYYHVNIETKEAGTISLKGDVTLIK